MQLRRHTLFALLFLAPGAGADFVALPEFGTSGTTIPVAWTDYDGDGLADLAVGNLGANEIYRNLGGGAFLGSGEFGAASTFALAWADYDNDGDPDMVVGNGSGGQNALYRNEGSGLFARLDRFGAGATNAVAWADYDLDGDLDLAVGNGLLGGNQQNFLYRNEGGDLFTEIAMFGPRQSASVVWGDANGDGLPDLAVGNGGFNFNGPNRLFTNNGDGTFTQTTEFSLGTDTSCLAWGDYDNDGDLDMAVMNWRDQQNYLYRNEGEGVFSQIPRFGARDPNTCAWADYDNDGDLDLAVGNGDFNSADSNFVYRNDGGSFVEIHAFGLGSTDGVAWADCDADGDLDLAVGNEHSPPQNFLYRNEASATDWVRLRLTGHHHDLGPGFSNRDGIGAKVGIYAAGLAGDPAHLLGFREQEAHGGFSSQNEPVLHFGAPGAVAVDAVIVWPGSGGARITQTVPGLMTGQVHAVDETGTPTDILLGTPTLEPTVSIAARPNPARSTVRFHVEASRSDIGELEILSITGRRVAVIPLRRESGHGFVANWNRESSSGRPAPSGVYFARVAGAQMPAKRFVLVQ